MATNHFKIEINAAIEKVWLALTNSEEFSKWMKNVQIRTDWNQGSEITYTCFDGNGNVVQWNGMDMIWHGTIKTINENKELTCLYPTRSAGLIEESYFLERIETNRTKLIQWQTLISQEVADGYKDGTAESLELLKNYLEKSE